MPEFISPLGRIVQGNAFEGQTTDSKGQALTIKTGPNVGKARTNFFLAIAFAKTDTAFHALYAQLVAEAKRGYPQYFDAAGNCTHPRMTYKIMDGDGVDADGKPNSAKEGFPGHWILKCSSSFAPKCFYTGKFAPHEQIQDPKAIKCGDYVRVMGTIEANIGSDVPGVYVNHNVVELCYAGAAITQGVDTSALAALALPPMPQGATALPVGLVGGGAPGLPGATPMAAPGSAGALPGATAAPALPGVPAAQPALPGATAAPALPGATPTPNPGFVAGALTLPGAPAPEPVYVMSPEATAGGHTRESLNQQGYTDGQLIANGWMKQQ